MKILHLLVCLFLATAHAEVVIKPRLSKTKPVIDGKYDSAWYGKETYEFSRIGFEGNLKIRTMIHEDSVYFLIQWQDEEENTQHKPWRWDGQKEAYVVGDEREDTLILRWGINIDDERINSANDLWMWGSVRTSQDYADDLYEIVSKKPLRSGIKKLDFKGDAYYLQNQGDVGRRCWEALFREPTFWAKADRYNNQIQPTGSRADVKAKAFWKNKIWTIEIERKLSTTNFDDVEFEWGKTYFFDICNQLLENAHIVQNVALIDDGLKTQERNPLVFEMPEFKEPKKKDVKKNKAADETD
ncbi:MAG: ethylbenzene dehydrogenase-related protein [Lentisphaerales bacterium]|nr:ethylbenzene dehydrogenase-related protein [Lentisphaerales bacterium]